MFYFHLGDIQYMCWTSISQIRVVNIYIPLNIIEIINMQQFSKSRSYNMTSQYMHTVHMDQINEIIVPIVSSLHNV